MELILQISANEYSIDIVEYSNNHSHKYGAILYRRQEGHRTYLSTVNADHGIELIEKLEQEVNQHFALQTQIVLSR